MHPFCKVFPCRDRYLNERPATPVHASGRVIVLSHYQRLPLKDSSWYNLLAAFFKYAQYYPAPIDLQPDKYLNGLPVKPLKASYSSKLTAGVPGGALYVHAAYRDSAEKSSQLRGAGIISLISQAPPR